MSQIGIIDLEAANPTIATSFTSDAGTAIPIANELEILGGTGIGTVGSGNTITINLDSPVDVSLGGSGRSSLTENAVLLGDGVNQVKQVAITQNGQLLIGSTSGTPSASTLTEGTGVSISNSAASIIIAASESVAIDFSTDSGTATPTGNELNIVGTSAQGISSSGSGSTVTLTVADATSAQKGVATFEAYDFATSTGNVSLTDGVQVMYVGKWGNDSADGLTLQSAKLTISAAITAITDAAVDKKYCLYVYPGEYSENVTMTDYIALLGVGGGRGVVSITASSGTVLTLNSGSSNTIKNIRIAATGTAEAINVPAGLGSNFIEFRNVGIEGTYSSRADDLVTVNSGEPKFIDCKFKYTETGDAATTVTHRIINLAAACVEIYILRCCAKMSITDTNANNVEGFYISSGANCDFVCMDGYFEFNTTVSGDVAIYRDADTLGSTERFFEGSHLHVVGNGGQSAHAFMLDNVATELRTTANIVLITGADFNLLADIGAAATLTSHFDDIVVDVEIYEGAGTYNYVNSPNDGKLEAQIVTVTEQLNLNADLGALAVGQVEQTIDILVEAGATTGGTYHVIDSSIGGDSGNSSIAVIGVNQGLDVLHHSTGASGVVGKAWSVDSTVWTDRTVAFNAGGTDVQIFAADNDVIYIGSLTTFGGVPVTLNTPSLQDINAVFEYWDGAWQTFSPSDNTNGFRNDGTIAFVAGDLTGWATTTVNGEGDGPWYYIRITRTRNNIVTPPTENTIQITPTSGALDFYWDKDGDVYCNSLALATVLDTQYGGTGVSTLTDHGVLVGSGIGAITPLAAAGNGELIIGSVGADPVLSTITAGSGISITNAAGSITVTNSAGGFAWETVTDATKQLAIQTGYIGNRGTNITYTLPDTAAVGSTIQITNIGAGLPVIAQNAGESINVVSSTTTVGVGGTLTGVEQFCSIELICVVADTTWNIVDMTGNWVVV